MSTRCAIHLGIRFWGPGAIASGSEASDRILRLTLGLGRVLRLTLGSLLANIRFAKPVNLDEVKTQLSRVLDEVEEEAAVRRRLGLFAAQATVHPDFDELPSDIAAAFGDATSGDATSGDATSGDATSGDATSGAK